MIPALMEPILDCAGRSPHYRSNLLHRHILPIMQDEGRSFLERKVAQGLGQRLMAECPNLWMEFSSLSGGKAMLADPTSSMVSMP